MKRLIPFLLVLALLFSLLPLSASAATDAGNSIDFAAPIEVNTKYSDSICDGYDVDYFVFTLEQAGTISFTFEHPAVLDQSNYWRLWIFDDKTEEVYYQAFNGTDTSTTTCTIGLPAGTFYLEIAGCDKGWAYGDWQTYTVGLPVGTFYLEIAGCDKHWNYGNWQRYSKETYSFKVNYTETAYAEREPNQSIAEATPITLEKTYSGSINATGDKDFYKFTLSKENTIEFVFTLPELSDDSKYWTVKVYDNTNAEVESFTIYGDETTQKFGGKTYSAGDYYVMISCADKITRKTYQFYVTTKHVVHVYETSVVTDPTCTEKGYITDTCACGHSRVFTFADALGHDKYVEYVVNATCTEKGYTVYSCWRCGKGYIGNYKDALGHNYKNGECTRCGKSDPNYTAPTVTVSFKDVAKTAWYKDAVDYAVSNGLMNGMGNNKFEPDTATNRAMLVTILWRYARSPVEGKNTFKDVKSGQWFTEAVTWAAKNGIVTGVGNNKFDPEGKLTREQLATILFRYSKQLGLNTSARADFGKFADGKKVQSWSKEAVQWAVAEGIIGGTSENGKLYLDPQGNATRAQVATILMRFIENVLK